MIPKNLEAKNPPDCVCFDPDAEARRCEIPAGKVVAISAVYVSVGESPEVNPWGMVGASSSPSETNAVRAQCSQGRSKVVRVCAAADCGANAAWPWLAYAFARMASSFCCIEIVVL